MKKYFYLSTICLLVLLMSSNVFAFSVNLYLDSNPNVNGPAAAFDAWQTAAFNSVIDGNFINMSNGTNPDNIGTTNVEIQDEVAYSFGDTGRNLAWIYQIVGATVEDLQSDPTDPQKPQRFGITLVSDWDVPGGWSYTFFSNDEPHHWVNYDSNNDGTVDGVIGSANWGWWGAYGENTQAALDADYEDWGSVGEHWTFTATLDGVDTVLEANRAPAPVPEPSTILLMGIGLLGLVGYSRKRKKS